MSGITTLYHAAVRAEWDARSQEHYEPAGYESEGFVHLSSAAQLVGTLHKHYPGRADLMLLTIDVEALSAAPIWEDLYGSGTEFPHVYASIELGAVSQVVPLPCDEHGRFDWWHPDESVVVHRATSATPTVHALLQHLVDGGFSGCPTPRWQRDGLGAVSYLAGRAYGYPLPMFLRATEPLEAFGAMLRSAHDLSEDFSTDGPWAAGDIGMRPGWVITHGDIGPCNILWGNVTRENGQPVGLIDWEFAEPGPRQYDLVAAAMNLCGHVDPSKHERAGLLGCNIDDRLAAFASGYGDTSAAELRTIAPDVAAERVTAYRERVASGIPRWQELEADDVGNRMEANLGFLRESIGGNTG
jgi:uncharacterized protein (DUF952 family)